MKKKISFAALSGVKLIPAGLSNEEVKSQRMLYGKNEIVEVFANPWWEILKETLKDPMIILLLVSGSLFLFLKNYEEAITLYIATLPLVLMDIYLHRRTNASTQSLRSQLDTTCCVRRGNQDLIIHTVDVVPGDLLVLQTGDFISADGYFENTSLLQIDETMLTGEALPVRKTSLPFSEINSFEKDVEIDSLGYAGTRVLRGQAVLRVLFVGANTEYGSIVSALSKVPHENTPLQNSIFRLVKILTLLGFIFCLVLGAARLYQGKGWLDAILSAAVLAVAAMPEEFPIVFSFFLGVGVYRMSKHKSLVRRAVTVENIGRVSQICTDKTGTLTLGELRLVQCESSQNTSEAELVKIAVIASDDNPTDPIDIAIQEYGVGISIDKISRLESFPFTESRKREVAIIKDSGGRLLCAAKGAPETILGMCDLTPAEKTEWERKVASGSSEGKKILACAFRSVEASIISQKMEPRDGFTFAGLLSFSDPIRPEVRDAVKYCSEQKIRILMLTGDHPSTAKAIAKSIGLGGDNPRVASAESVPEDFTRDGIMAKYSNLTQLDVIARCSPLQKLWIVQAFKFHKEIVAVTGDGVNDVPALQAADIGIAMGRRGVKSAREVASIVLTDDNFASIVDAIREGRQLFKNLNNSFEYLLLIQIPLVLGAAFVPLAGYSLLYLPIHLVWLELIIHPTSLLAFQLPVSHQNDQRPMLQDKRFFSKHQLSWILVESALLLGSILYSYIRCLHEGKGEEYARASALSMMCFTSAAIVLRNTRLRTQSAKMIFVATIVSTVVLVQTPGLAKPLMLIPLDGIDWIRNILMILLVFTVSKLLQSSVFTKILRR